MSTSASDTLRRLGLPLVLCVVGTAATLAPASAQGAGFTPGELFIYSPVADDSNGQDGALVRLDPFTGRASPLVDLETALQSVGAATFDPYRQRVVFSGVVAGVPASTGLWFADGEGHVQKQSLPQNGTFHSLAPTGDGRIYMRDFNTSSSPLKWIDAAGSLHTLLDDTGSAPFKIDGTGSFSVRGMIYDPATNALFASASTPCPGGPTNRITIRKLPLSVDGARVIGPVDCAEYNVSTTAEGPIGWSHLPGGLLLLGTDTNSNALEPRLLIVDPLTLAVGVFATNGDYTAGAGEAACWSSALGKSVILDTFGNALRAFAQGEVGEGTVISPSWPISSPGGSGEVATLLEIPVDGCRGGYVAYGSGLAGAGGLVPTLTGGGCPQPGELYSLDLGQVVGGAPGALLIDLAPGALPFKGGTLHLGGVLVSFALTLGGAPGVPGAGALTIPGLMPNDGALSGASLFLQTAWIDAAAVKGVSLSNGLELEIG